jgi:hypothetical protein
MTRRSKWTQYHNMNGDLLNLFILNKMWIPLDRKSVNCRGFLEVCYVGAVYVDALKKE